MSFRVCSLSCCDAEECVNVVLSDVDGARDGVWNEGPTDWGEVDTLTAAAA